MSAGFSVTFLGTGSAIPDGEHAQAGLLLERRDDPDSDDSGTDDGAGGVLVDCGSGVLNNLARTDPGFEGISTVLLTHHHLDHLADLMSLIKARWLVGAEELEVVGPDGTDDLLTGLFEVHEYMQGRIDLTVREVGPGDFRVPGFDVAAKPTRHSMDCLAYRFEPIGTEAASDNGNDDPDSNESEATNPAFTFSGDSEAFSDLIAFADGSTLAHDCSFPDDVDVSNHPTPAQLGDALAAADATIDRVYLTHLYPHTRGRHEEMLASIADSYNGDVRFAHDGMVIDLD